MQASQVMELLTSRRSVRKFSGQPVSPQMLDQILEAGRWAPSGLNNQPWRFVVVTDQALKAKLAGFTKYRAIVEGAAAAIPVFIHKPSMYNPLKDYQSVGACLQNMLLMAHGLGLGAVWLGEILNNADGVRDALGLDQDLELMAVLAIGHPGPGSPKSSRKNMDDLVLARHMGQGG